MAVDRYTSLVGIIGFPLGHSASPKMHKAAFEYKKLPFVYLPFSVKKDRLRQAVKGLQAIGCRGVNVTIPYKEKVLPFLTHKDDSVIKTGSVNTILFEGESIKGFNTDSYGFQRAISPFLKGKKKLKIIILGAGGTCRAILFALSQWKLSEIIVANRTLSRARKVKKNFLWLQPEEFRVRSLDTPWRREELSSCDLLVQTTSVGMWPDRQTIPFPFEALPPSCTVVDVIYNPGVTSFLRRAQRYRLRTVNGLPMLLYQGVKAFELFTQKRAPVKVMGRALGIKP